MTGKMTGKVALVTGAGMGIGRAIALAFADEGASVVVVDMNHITAQETVELIKKKGGNGVAVKCDVSNAEEVKNMVETAVKEFGRLDYACNNAGMHLPGVESLVELKEDVWDRYIAVNLKGVMLGMKYEAQVMLKQGGGVIVNTASTSGLLADPTSYSYAASKHGVMGLTKCAALEFAKAGIRVNAVCPGSVETPMVASAPDEVKQAMLAWMPIGRFGKPEEIAAAVIWLCSDLAAFVTGAGIVLDGGATIV